MVILSVVLIFGIAALSACNGGETSDSGNNNVSGSNENGGSGGNNEENSDSGNGNTDNNNNGDNSDGEESNLVSGEYIVDVSWTGGMHNYMPLIVNINAEDNTFNQYYASDSATSKGSGAVTLSGCNFYAENSGGYRLVYRAESSAYKTMLGSNTYSEYVVTITAVEEVAEVAYFNDSSVVIAQSATMQASKITAGAVYDAAADAMANISDSYEVFSVLLYDSGKEVALSSEIELYIYTSLNASKAAVYYMDGDGDLTELSAQSDGEYAVITTDKTGTFIVCIPGVAMSKMTKMIILAVMLLVMIIAIAVTIPVVIHNKRKKKSISGK